MIYSVKLKFINIKYISIRIERVTERNLNK